MTIVKVQRPFDTNMAHRPWRIYDKFNARDCTIPEADMPKHVVEAMNGRTHRLHQFKSFFIDAEWVREEQRWDLSNAKLTEDKRW